MHGQPNIKRMERVAITQVFLMVGTCQNIGHTKHGAGPIAAD